MSRKKKVDLSEFFNIILAEGLTPNQAYLLYSLKEGVSPLHINLHQELRGIDKKWLFKTKEGKYAITVNAVSLIQKLESYFRISKKKTDTQIMGEGFEEKVLEYNEMFPRRKLGSGKPARANKKIVQTALRWFFENFDYDWETVILATGMYIEYWEEKNFTYTQNSQYFIRKQNSDKTWNSALADWCELALNGEEEEAGDVFGTKVV